ncbi:CorA-like Mg2+ transporter protein [Streptomyces sp. 3213]|nr:CorA-like Mg2+ transporter protein [Streptomyces sp. 3213] [Streptomyces sp. 3213.3]
MERRLKVTASPAVQGSWSWMQDRDGKDRVDYRPEKKTGTDVTLHMDLAGVGVYGAEQRVVNFTIGDAMTSTVDVDKKTMTVAKNGRTLRTLKISSWAAILFAPTLVGTIYGMNFHRMPEFALGARIPLRHHPDGGCLHQFVNHLSTERLALSNRPGGAPGTGHGPDRGFRQLLPGRWGESGENEPRSNAGGLLRSRALSYGSLAVEAQAGSKDQHGE